MIQLFVPTIGTRLLLAKPWSFDLNEESRNKSLFEVLGYNSGYFMRTTKVISEEKVNVPVYRKYNGKYCYSPDPIDSIGYADMIKQMKLIMVNPAIPNNHIANLLLAKCVISSVVERTDCEDNLSIIQQDHAYINMTLPINTILKVVRIYIRQGLEDYDSITFVIEDCPILELKSKKSGGLYKGKQLRFWAKLEDVNTIICDII